MSLPVSDNFIAASEADINQPVAEVDLVLGNYFSSPAYGTTIAGSTQTANYPATGAIDGDRTEINVGPASGADNGIGLSSWRSTTIPDSSPAATLTMTFTTSRTINRIKLYHLSSHGLKEYKLSYWDGSAYVDFAGTSGSGFTGGVTIVSTHELDTIDFDDVTSTKIRLSVTATVVALDFANVVEIEAYRLIDITSRVKGIQLSRQRDYKIRNPMSANVTLECINDDRFFSISHTPTTEEIADGFVNSELLPNIGIIIYFGFNYSSSAPELVSVFVGNVDRITMKPISRTATIEARDGLKALINRIDSTRLKSAQDITTNIQYVLNRSNISDWEMALDTTSIVIDYFFTDKQNQLSTVRDLTEAAVDSLFYFDEGGIATFKFYVNSTPQSHLYSTQPDWQAGTYTNIDTTSDPGEISLLFFDRTTVGWTVVGTAFNFDSNGVYMDTSGGLVYAYQAATGAVGNWIIPFQLSKDLGGNIIIFHLPFMCNGFGATGVRFQSGYSLRVIFEGPPVSLGIFSLFRLDAAGAQTAVGGDYVVLGLPGTGTHNITINRTSAGVMSFYYDGTFIFSQTDTTYTTSTIFGYRSESITPSGQKLYFLAKGPALPDPGNTGTWTSPALDLGVNVNSLGLLEATTTVNGASILFYTASSADNVTYEAYALVSGNGQINSTVQRYLKTRVVITLASDGQSPYILDITINWTTSSTSGSTKYPPPPSSFTFSFDSTLLDVEQEVSDNLGGDTAILNDVIVQAQPLVLTGANADPVWKGTLGSPPTIISGTNPLTVTNGQILTYQIVITSGMDTSRMSGANPAAAVVTFGGGGAGSWIFSSIHPTLPVLQITITGNGTITDLEVQGKIFSNASYLQAQQTTDTTSIAKNGDRQLTISNAWIVSTAVANTISQSLVDNYKDPISYIPSAEVRPIFSAQLGDRVTVEDVNLDLSGDYIIVGLTHGFSVQGQSGDVKTGLVLLSVPAGS